jgi:hypothetical protein
MLLALCYPWPMSRYFVCGSLLCLVATAACGGSVESHGGSGGATTTTTGQSTDSTTTMSSSSTTTSSGGGGGSAPCAGEVQVIEDNGSPQIFGSVCDSSWGSDHSDKAVGYIFMGGPAPGAQGLVILGCASPQSGSPRLSLAPTDAVTPGTYTAGTTSYTDSQGITWGVSVDPFELTVTSLGDVGESIVGFYSVMVTHGGNAARDLAGSFDVCRIPDMIAP